MAAATGAAPEVAPVAAASVAAPVVATITATGAVTKVEHTSIPMLESIQEGMPTLNLTVIPEKESTTTSGMPQPSPNTKKAGASTTQTRTIPGSIRPTT